MTYYLGIDGGGSKTLALVTDEGGAALGVGMGGPSNYQTAGVDAALAAIVAALESACAAAGVRPADLAHSCMCLAGLDFDVDWVHLGPRLRSLGLPRPPLLRNNSAAALRAGCPHEWGVVVICGSGFNAAGVGRDGREVRLPSLGAPTGDWGGGGDLGVAALGAVLRAADGRNRPTALREAVLAATGCADEEALILAIHNQQLNWPKMRRLAPLIFEVAAAGDAVAQRIVLRQAREVAQAAVAIIRRLDLQAEQVPVVLGGSIFSGAGDLLINHASRLIRRTVPRAVIGRPPFVPAVGALLLALEDDALAVGPATYGRLRETLPGELVLG